MTWLFCRDMPSKVCKHDIYQFTIYIEIHLTFNILIISSSICWKSSEFCRYCKKIQMRDVSIWLIVVHMSFWCGDWVTYNITYIFNIKIDFLMAQNPYPLPSDGRPCTVLAKSFSLTPYLFFFEKFIHKNYKLTTMYYMCEYLLL